MKTYNIMDDLIKEKIHNFRIFCCEKFPDNELIKTQAEHMALIPVSLLVEYFKEHVLKYRDDIEQFVKKMAEQYKIEFESLSEVDQKKFRKYFEFFVEMADSF